MITHTAEEDETQFHDSSIFRQLIDASRHDPTMMALLHRRRGPAYLQSGLA